MVERLLAAREGDRRHRQEQQAGRMKDEGGRMNFAWRCPDMGLLVVGSSAI